MALLNTYTSANRVIEEDLHTTYRRETVLKRDSDVGAAYLKYTRIRTKRYKYVGLTHQAAIDCANAKDLMFQRKIFPWQWDSDSRIWRMDDAPVNNKYIVVSCGRATPTHVGGGCWEVSVEVDEEITIPFRDTAQQDSERLPNPWTSFESNPSMLTDEFMGINQYGVKVDFDYDTAD